MVDRKKKISKKIWLLAAIVFVFTVFGAGAFLSMRQPSVQTGNDVIITLTEDGFTPETLTIKKGTTVTFRSETGEFFWPASNLHPSHEIYPQFDPKEPIAKDKTWSFRFDRIGEWKYHDHIAPYYTGIISVSE